MKNDNLRFIIDSRCFDGSCVTVMSDGIHSDYGHETLEELRERENNPNLIAVPGNAICKKMQIHLQSLCAPFCEITEEDYFDYMDTQPPIRHTRNFFFMSEPYHAGIHRFCFRTDGRYFTGLRSVNTPRKDLEQQMDRHYRKVTFKGGTLKEKPMGIFDHTRHSFTVIVPYLFLDKNGEKKFICNLVKGTDESSGKDARQETARVLQSLRRHHFLYFSGYEGNDDMGRFLERVVQNPVSKRGFSAISHQPRVCVFRRNGQRNRGKVLLPHLRPGTVPLPAVQAAEHQNGKEGSAGLNQYAGWVPGRVSILHMYQKSNKKTQYEPYRLLRPDKGYQRNGIQGIVCSHRTAWSFL